MGFSEKTQAFIAAAYYKHLKGQFGERGKEAFVHGVKHYARQRGSRMAQRAIRDGEPLNYGTFCRYGEWIPSQEVIKAGEVSVTEIKSVAPDYEYHVTFCPWFLGFREADGMEAGALYCGCLDEAINQGFNGAILFHTVQTMHQGKCCIFRIEQAGMEKERDTQKLLKYVRDYDYHTAHLYFALGEIARSIFGMEGERICREVILDFQKKYGAQMTEELRAYEKENFNCC